MSDGKDIAALVRNIRGNDESSRKLAAFHLQNLVGHQEFAEALVRVDGVPALCLMIMRENGNTLAYALGCLNGILEKGIGWQDVTIDVAEKAVDLVVSKAVVNVLRNSLRFLVLIASRSSPMEGESAAGPDLERLKPILTSHPDLLANLVERLSSADHALCANALQFLNALLRDALSTFTEAQFTRFIKRLQDLNVFAVIEHMLHGEMAEEIEGPVVGFYNLTRIVLQSWCNTTIDLTRPMHKDAFSVIQRCVRQRPSRIPTWQEQRKQKRPQSADTEPDVEDVSWVSLGFESEMPSVEFESTGLLGLIDLAEFAQIHGDFLRNALLEQAVTPVDRCCPLARVSLTATELLNEHFNIRDGPCDNDLDACQPLLMCRDKIHASLVHAFLRLWDESGATVAEYEKIESLVALLVVRVIATLDRQATAEEVEVALSKVTLDDLRNWQVAEIEVMQTEALGDDLVLLKERIHAETMHFVIEQRIKCLLDGAWFPTLPASSDPVDAGYIRPAGAAASGSTWRYAQLSPNRKYLHHIVLHDRTSTPPTIAEMEQRINVNHISSVVSSVMQGSSMSEVSSLVNGHDAGPKTTYLTIHGSGLGHGPQGVSQDERVLLELPCPNVTLAAEWLDGLLMLLDQAPITADTARLISTIEDWSLRVRLLGLHAEDIERRADEIPLPIPRPEHEGEYWYDMGEG